MEHKDMEKYQSTISGHALVLGGSGEIGIEVVRSLVANWKVGETPRISFSYNSNKAAAEQLAGELKKNGVEVYFSTINQSDDNDVERFLEEAVATHGGIEITHVVNTIGISPNKNLLEQTLETPAGAGKDDVGWREVFEVNVFGPFISTRVIAMRMKERGVEGSIVLITSTNGINSQSQISVHYDTSKAAQAHMMLNLAEFFAPAGIRINGVAPGWINTRLNASLPPEEKEKETKRIWVRRFIPPHRVAKYVVMVLMAEDVIGTNPIIDGGYR